MFFNKTNAEASVTKALKARVTNARQRGVPTGHTSTRRSVDIHGYKYYREQRLCVTFNNLG
jgi:hypothetical protein